MSTSGSAVPMASPPSSIEADPHFDCGLAARVAEDHFTDLEQSLAMLVQASYPADARACRGASADAAGPAISPITLGAADLRRSAGPLGKRNTLGRVAMAVGLAASAMWAWRSFGGEATDASATSPAPFGWLSMRQVVDRASALPPATTAADEPGIGSADRRQIETMADLAALRQTVEKLAIAQERLTRELARLHASKRQASKPLAEKSEKSIAPHGSAPPASPGRGDPGGEHH